MTHGAVIDVASLRFRWPSASAPCLAIESFKVEAGERVFLFGPSGSGKSTLLALLAGVLTAQEGSVRVLGTDLSSLRGRDRFRVEHVGFIFQQFNLVPYLSVVDNVLLPCRFSAKRARRAAEAHGSPLAFRAALARRHGTRHRPAQAQGDGAVGRPATARGGGTRTHRFARTHHRRRADVVAGRGCAAGIPRALARAMRPVGEHAAVREP